MCAKMLNVAISDNENALRFYILMYGHVKNSVTIQRKFRKGCDVFSSALFLLTRRYTHWDSYFQLYQHKRSGKRNHHSNHLFTSHLLVLDIRFIYSIKQLLMIEPIIITNTNEDISRKLPNVMVGFLPEIPLVSENNYLKCYHNHS